MSAPEARTNCPSSEILAAFIDDRLDPETRKKVIEHLAVCDDCRDIILGAADMQDTEVRPFRRKSAARYYGALAVALAASVLIFVIVPSDFFRRDPMKRLVRASAGLSYRPVEARLSGDFEHHPPKKVLRGVEHDDSLATALIEAEAADLKDPHARGVAAVLLGKPDEAIANLERARGEDNDERLLSDLSVAYYARAKRKGNQADYVKALDAAERAWRIKQRPESAWNRAVAATALEQRDRAEAAWRDYLAISGGDEPKWRKEAEQKLEELRDPL